MADLTFPQGADPVCIFNDTSGNQVVVNSDGSINTNSLLKVGGIQGTVTVGTSAIEAKVGGSRYAGRKLLMIQPLSTNVFFGFTAGVTTSTGIALASNQIVTFDIGDIPIYLITTVGTKTVVVVEAA